MVHYHIHINKVAEFTELDLELEDVEDMIPIIKEKMAKDELVFEEPGDERDGIIINYWNMDELDSSENADDIDDLKKALRDIGCD